MTLLLFIGLIMVAAFVIWNIWNKKAVVNEANVEAIPSKWRPIWLEKVNLPNYY